LTRFAIVAFTFGPSEDNTISLLTGSQLSARASNTGKYRTQTKYRKVQDSYKNTGIYRIYRTAGITVTEVYSILAVLMMHYINLLF